MPPIGDCAILGQVGSPNRDTPGRRKMRCARQLSRPIEVMSSSPPSRGEPFFVTAWGISEVNLDFGETADEMLAGFRLMMETLAPDTIGWPICMIDDSWSDHEITSFY